MIIPCSFNYFVVSIDPFVIMKILIVISALFAVASAGKGILELDDVTFPKVVDGSHNVLVAYLEYSWKDPKDYDQLNADFPDVIIAKYDLSGDDGQKEKFSTLPTFNFHAKGSSAPASLVGEADHATLSEFVRLQLNPKLADLKRLASSFIGSISQRAQIQKNAEDIVNSLASADKEYAQYFVTVMKKITEKGVDFVNTESARLSGLISNKSTAEKKRHDFNSRLNIVKAFEQ